MVSGCCPRIADVPAQVAELADAEDLKSSGRKAVRVQVPAWALSTGKGLQGLAHFHDTGRLSGLPLSCPCGGVGVFSTSTYLWRTSRLSP